MNQIDEARERITQIVTQYILDWEAGRPEGEKRQKEITKILQDLVDSVTGRNKDLDEVIREEIPE